MDYDSHHGKRRTSMRHTDSVNVKASSTVPASSRDPVAYAHHFEPISTEHLPPAEHVDHVNLRVYLSRRGWRPAAYPDDATRLREYLKIIDARRTRDQDTFTAQLLQLRTSKFSTVDVVNTLTATLDELRTLVFWPELFLANRRISSALHVNRSATKLGLHRHTQCVIASKPDTHPCSLLESLIRFSRQAADPIKRCISLFQTFLEGNFDFDNFDLWVQQGMELRVPDYMLFTLLGLTVSEKSFPNETRAILREIQQAYQREGCWPDEETVSAIRRAAIPTSKRMTKQNTNNSSHRRRHSSRPVSSSQPNSNRSHFPSDLCSDGNRSREDTVMTNSLESTALYTDELTHQQVLQAVLDANAHLAELLRATRNQADAHTQSSVPDYFKCRITQEIMHDPVQASDGMSYEREAIDTWLSLNNTSPWTRARMSKRLTRNLQLKQAIEDWKSKTGYPSGLQVSWR